MCFCLEKKTLKCKNQPFDLLLDVEKQSCCEDRAGSVIMRSRRVWYHRHRVTNIARKEKWPHIRSDTRLFIFLMSKVDEIELPYSYAWEALFACIKRRTDYWIPFIPNIPNIMQSVWITLYIYILLLLLLLAVAVSPNNQSNTCLIWWK